MICALARWEADHMRACVDVVRACVAKGHEQATQPRSAGLIIGGLAVSLMSAPQMCPRSDPFPDEEGLLLLEGPGRPPRPGPSACPGKDGNEHLGHATHDVILCRAAIGLLPCLGERHGGSRTGRPVIQRRHLLHAPCRSFRRTLAASIRGMTCL